MFAVYQIKLLLNKGNLNVTNTPRAIDKLIWICSTSFLKLKNILG